MEQAPECWGKFDQCGRLCEFAAACRLCTETESRMDRALGGQEFDSVAEWAPDLMPWDCKKKTSSPCTRNNLWYVKTYGNNRASNPREQGT